MENQHVPVMLDVVLEFLRPEKGQIIIDCTLGGGAYTYDIAKKVGAKGLVIALDADEKAIKYNQVIINKKKIKNIVLYHENFQNLSNIFKKEEIFTIGKKISGIVFDLGLSSNQLADRRRGFSFQLDAPLDMAFSKDVDNVVATTEIVNKYKFKELFRVIRDYGEERYANSISKAIIRAREEEEIKTTKELVDIIAEAVPGKYRHAKIHFATKTFQALRIETNDELNALKTALKSGLDNIKKGGKIVVLSFHSLEDRIVKNFFRDESKHCLCPKELPTCRCGHTKRVKILNKKIITPSLEEIKNNKRSRSAKLRAVEKI
ncbi:MAG: 16S rRNA (cytosine(1402)-N(4))-methyltransferase RsmH [Patescibacteria group bacterium]|nr:16S rRNA (cytosine(1402)-N(4))-methyltransferase RsmH [Patescibacteria group bacterium]